MTRPDSADDEGDVGSVSVSDIFSVHDRPMRREVLQFLADRPSRRAGLDQLIEHLAERRSAGEAPVERDRIALQLHHVHLPKLADIGVIEYDSDSDSLRYHPDDDLERYLEITQQNV